MSYNQKITDKIAKFKQFFEDKSPGQILAIIPPYTFDVDYTRWGIEPRTLNSWDFDTQLDAFADYNIRKVQCYNEYTKDLDNDHIPALSAQMGVALYSAYLTGGDVTFGEETSWTHHVVNEWEELVNIKIGQDNNWLRTILHITKRYVDSCDGSYATSTLSHFSPTDMANALRGNNLFYDYYDEPQKVHELLDKCADATIWMEKEMRKIVKPIAGGTVTANVWFNGGAPFLSEDVADLCSPDLYRDFGFKYTQKVIDSLGGAYIHHHAKGFHVHGEIARLAGLKLLEISWDPNCPRPIDHLEEVFECSNGMPLMTRCTAADVYEKIDVLKKGRIILMLNIDSLEEGGEVMRFIRKHSRI